MTTENPDHLVLFSGGIGSFEAARRVITKFGNKRVKLWFFDTLIEDEDLYRFLDDAERILKVKIIRLCDGRTPWEVFNDERYIGNSRADLCSKHLKRILLERELRRVYPNKNDVVLYFGLDWSESHRIDVLKPKWKEKGYKVDFPLVWEPWEFPDQYKKKINNLGIRIPRLYDLGFPHNNCGGACVKAGIYQWSLLLETFPERYKWHEENEQKIRKSLGKNVAILRNRNGGRTRPMTLRFLRWRLRDKTSLEKNSFGAEILDDSSCSCFVNLEELTSV